MTTVSAAEGKTDMNACKFDRIIIVRIGTYARIMYVNSKTLIGNTM
jgi:hypothetical protein